MTQLEVTIQKGASVYLTPGECAKANNITLNHITALTGISRQTLTNWYHNRRQLFDIVVTGCITTLKEQKSDEH